jgi:chemotaxis methyl-accepting protein methylase
VTRDLLTELAQRLRRRTGVALDGTMHARLERCLRDAAAATATSVEGYAERALTEDGALQRLVECIAIHESSFFRDPNQFDAFARHVLPSLTGPVRIWSCGCARGQEPYSLAMVLAEAAHPDASVIATDISAPALAFARAGVYPEAALAGVSPYRRATWLVPDHEGWSVQPTIRRRVSFESHNLVSDPPPVPPGRCQVVFCRNVLIYFGPDALLSALDRIHAWLPPGGLLFLGYAESLWQVTDKFEVVRLGDAFVYRKPSATAPASSATTTATTRTEPHPTRGEPRQPPPPDAGPMLNRGEQAMASGDLDGAVTAFRQATYVDSSHPVAYIELGMALDAQGNADAARRAFRVARTMLRHADPATLPADLAGYQLDTIVRLIDAKLTGDPR